MRTMRPSLMTAICRSAIRRRSVFTEAENGAAVSCRVSRGRDREIGPCCHCVHSFRFDPLCAASSQAAMRTGRRALRPRAVSWPRGHGGVDGLSRLIGLSARRGLVPKRQVSVRKVRQVSAGPRTPRREIHLRPLPTPVRRRDPGSGSRPADLNRCLSGDGQGQGQEKIAHLSENIQACRREPPCRPGRSGKIAELEIVGDLSGFIRSRIMKWMVMWRGKATVGQARLGTQNHVRAQNQIPAACKR